MREQVLPAKHWEKYAFKVISTEKEHGGKNRRPGNETVRGLYLDEVADSKVMLQLASAAMGKGSMKVLEQMTRTMKVADFAAAAKVMPDTARRFLAEAVEDGVAIREHGSGTKPDVYTPTGNAWLGLMGKAEK